MIRVNMPHQRRMILPLATSLVFFCLFFSQFVKCVATDASLSADPGVVSSIPARSNPFVEIAHEIISTVIFLPSA